MGANSLTNGFYVFRSSRLVTAVRYVLRGEFMNARVRIFDYRPRAAGCHWQTVVAFQLIECRVPAFELCPATKVPPDGSIPDGFSLGRHYVVRGTNEDGVRRLFPRSAGEYFKRNPGWSIEGGGDWLLVYRHDRCCRARKLWSFLMDAYRAYHVFRIK